MGKYFFKSSLISPSKIIILLVINVVYLLIIITKGFAIEIFIILALIFNIIGVLIEMKFAHSFFIDEDNRNIHITNEWKQNYAVDINAKDIISIHKHELFWHGSILVISLQNKRELRIGFSNLGKSKMLELMDKINQLVQT